MESRQHLLVAEIDRLGMERTDLIAKVKFKKKWKQLMPAILYSPALIIN